MKRLVGLLAGRNRNRWLCERLCVRADQLPLVGIPVEEEPDLAGKPRSGFRAPAFLVPTLPAPALGAQPPRCSCAG